MSSQSGVSVVIVSYNTRDLLRQCLSSIEPEHEVIVVDNASADGSVEMVRTEFSEAKLIANSANRGFGAANNQGIDVASRQLILLLNSDAWAKPGAIEELASVFDRDEIVAAGGKLLNPDGSLQESTANALTLWAVLCEQFYLEKLFSPYWRSRRFVASDPLAKHETSQVMGACLMFRPLERFDERYFLYCEDTDLCYRLRKHGKIVYVPSAEFFHQLGSSSTANRWKSVARYNRGKELYFLIHHGRIASLTCWVLDRVGALMRLAVWALIELLTVGRRGRGQAGLFWKVLTSPTSGPPPG